MRTLNNFVGKKTWLRWFSYFYSTFGASNANVIRACSTNWAEVLFSPKIPFSSQTSNWLCSSDLSKPEIMRWKTSLTMDNGDNRQKAFSQSILYYLNKWKFWIHSPISTFNSISGDWWGWRVLINGFDASMNQRQITKNQTQNSARLFFFSSYLV